MKCNCAIKDRRHLVMKSNAREINHEGRYGIPTQGTVPAFSILNGA